MTDRDKLTAFLALLAAIVVLAILPTMRGLLASPLPDAAYKLVDNAMTILGTAFGAAALALFRTSQATNDMASALKTQAESAAAAAPPTTVLSPGQTSQAAPAPAQE